MRCESCQKFVSFDTESDPEITVDVDPDGIIDGECRITNNCAECSEELTETTFTIEASVKDEVDAHRADHPDDPAEHDHLEIGTVDATRSDRVQSHSPSGKPLVGPARYRKRYYGAEATITVECKCGEKFETTWADEVQASAMDPLQ